MKPAATILATLLALTAIAHAETHSPAYLVAEQAYHQGLYLQRTVGDLDGALAAFDRALESANKADASDLVESILLRRAECFELLGDAASEQTAIAALRKTTDPKDSSLGPARYLPPESDIVLQVDLAALRRSPLLKDLNIQADLELEESKQIAAVLGFDPFKSLHRLTAGATLTDSDSMPVGHWALVFEGDFQGFQPEAVLESQKEQLANFVVKQRTLHGARVYSAKLPLPEGGVNVMSVGLARLDDHHILVGEMNAVTSFLAARAGKSPGLRANRKLSNLQAYIPQSTSFWLAAVPDQILEKVKELKNVPGLANLPKLQGILLTGRLDQDLAASAVAWASDNESARALGDVCRGLVALARFIPTEDPLEKKGLQSLSVETRDREVKVSITVPGDLIRKEAREQTSTEHKKTIRMKTDSVMFISLPGITHIKVKHPKVADVKATGEDAFKVFGLSPGKTTILVKLKDQPDVRYQVIVDK